MCEVPGGEEDHEVVEFALLAFTGCWRLKLPLDPVNPRERILTCPAYSEFGQYHRRSPCEGAARGFISNLDDHPTLLAKGHRQFAAAKGMKPNRQTIGFRDHPTMARTPPGAEKQVFEKWVGMIHR